MFFENVKEERFCYIPYKNCGVDIFNFKLFHWVPYEVLEPDSKKKMLFKYKLCNYFVLTALFDQFSV